MGTLPDVWGGQHGPLWRSSKQCGVSGAWNARYAPHDANAMRRPSPGTSTRMLPEASASHTPDDAPLGLPRVRQLGTRWLRPEARRDTRKIRTFSQTTNPSPESVTRRYEGERVTLELRAEAPRKRWHRRRTGRREEHACSARWQLGARGAPSLRGAHSRR
jgi:hypothetical protein